MREARLLLAFASLPFLGQGFRPIVSPRLALSPARRSAQVVSPYRPTTAPQWVGRGGLVEILRYVDPKLHVRGGKGYQMCVLCWRFLKRHFSVDQALLPLHQGSRLASWPRGAQDGNAVAPGEGGETKGTQPRGLSRMEQVGAWLCCPYRLHCETCFKLTVSL
jgi:hypothetical protein